MKNNKMYQTFPAGGKTKQTSFVSKTKLYSAKRVFHGTWENRCGHVFSCMSWRIAKYAQISKKIKKQFKHMDKYTNQIQEHSKEIKNMQSISK